MKNFRRKYYDAFSKYYDRFVALHSRDTQGGLRKFLSSKIPVKEGDSVLDMCTGTGILLLYLQQRVGPKGFVTGIDFSRGMLEVCKMKTRAYSNIEILESDVAYLPFKDNSFDAVTCSHAFYELKGETRERMLKETVRVLKPGKSFLMMEHDLPENPVIRTLLYIRLLSMGAKRALDTLKHEKETLENYFKFVEKLETRTGRSKVMVCRN
ncbi:MAG: class I SAM-dependent methyltransferase [Deltaproteobacteria bacterium]|nr:class I SAM-dependent methyltransferase [Deltaproteobacteria bacterium]